MKFSIAVVALVIVSVSATSALNWLWSGGLPDAQNIDRGQLLLHALGAALVFSGAGYVLARQLAKPIQSLQASLASDAGDPTLTGRSDEIGAIAQSAQSLKSAAAQVTVLEQERQQYVSAVTEALEKLKAGDLKHRIRHELPDGASALKSSFNDAAAELEARFGSISSHAALIRKNARDIGQTTDQLSQRTENQAATLEESSAAIEEMATSVASTAEGAKHADELVGSAKSSAEASGVVMDQAVEAMKQIETSSARISQVVSVIDDIAFQTNLLALNASVEAARAGDAGRGFAVVASEVRALAQRSSDAAKEIETLMAESESHVGTGVQHVHKAVDTLRSIASSVTEISAAVSGIASTAQEQSLGVSEINSAISALDQATQQTAAMVSDSATAGKSLSKQADELEQFVLGFGGPLSAPSAPIAPQPAPAPVASKPKPVTPSAPAPVEAPNPVGEQQEKLARYVASEGSAALKMDEPADSDWVEF
ncbi:MAG: methyl-accepting chemotaxis protein [Pseudomonadota bacterium]